MPGEQLGVQCLAQGSHLSRGIEGGESAGYSLPPTTIPAGPEIRTHDLRVTSPTLYPLGHDCPRVVLTTESGWPASPCVCWPSALSRMPKFATLVGLEPTTFEWPHLAV